MARPTKYKAEYCERLVEHMSNGLSFESFAAVIDVTEETLHDWKRKTIKKGVPNPRYHEEFSESYKKGRNKSLLFWEDVGIKGMAGIPFSFKDGKKNKLASRGFSAATYIFNMKNRFGWTDRQDITSKDKQVTTGKYVIYYPKQLPSYYWMSEEERAKQLAKDKLKDAKRSGSSN